MTQDASGRRHRGSRRGPGYSLAAAQLIALAVSIAIAPHARGENAPDQTAQASTGDTLEAVVITAEKRSEDLGKVPISATVVSAADLAVKNVNTIQDLANVAPGVSISPESTGESFINIRGVGVQATTSTSSNGVVFYVDSQYIPDNFTNLFSLFDIGSVQILRGPQGTLVGVNATGGAVLVSTAQPQLGSTSGYYTQTIGNYSDFKEEGAINLPISNTLAARAAFVSETEDSFTKNLGSGVPGTFNLENPGNVNTQAVRLQLLWQPYDGLSVTARMEKFQSRTDGPALKPIANPATDPFSAGLQNQPYVVAYSAPTFFDVYGERGSAEIKWDIIPGIQLRSVTSIQDGHESDTEDFDFGRDVANWMLTRRTDVQTFTQELNLLSTGDGPLQWVAGIYYLDTSTPLELDFTLQPPGTPAPIIAFGSPGGVAKHFSEAAFAQVTYAFSPSWSVVVGGRYTEDRLPFNTISDAGGFTFATHTEPTSDKPTGKAAVNWNFTPDSLLYASISSGYKAGGGNLAGPSYEDETNVVTELGLKTTLLDHHLRFTIDGFNSDYQHIQLQQFVNGSPDTTNAAGARFDGGELETTGILGDFRFDGSAAYLHGYFSGPFVYSSNTLPTVAGSPTPYSPTWQFEVGAQYDLHLGSGGKITPRAQWSYQGEQNTIPEFAGQTLPVYNQIQARGIVDLNLTYKALEHWTVAAYALNVGNRVYVANTVSTGLGANALQYGAPRQFGVRATYAFGSTGQ